MKSTVDRLEGLSRKINFEIPVEKVQEAFERVYKAIKEKANIKGFRQGKAPLATIRSLYGDQAKSDVVNNLVNDAYPNALEQHQLEPVGYPKISFHGIHEDKPFTFTAEFEVRPEVQLKKYDGLPVLRERMSIPGDAIEKVLENIRQSKAEAVTVFDDRALVTGDVAVINFIGSVGGQPLPNGSADGHELEIGANQFIDGFEEGLTGMKIGDSRTLNLRFPEGYHEASLSGAPVTFDVKLTGIKKKVLPELTDDFAKSLGGFESLADLKEKIQKDLTESETKRIREDVKNRIVRALVDANPIEAPRSLVEQQKESLAEDIRKRMESQGMGEGEFAEYRQKWDKDFESSATFMVKSTFLLDALADKLDLKAKPGDVEDKINQTAKETGIDISRLLEFYGNEDRRSRLAFQLTEEKVVNYLVDHANVTEVDKDKLPQEAD